MKICQNCGEKPVLDRPTIARYCSAACSNQAAKAVRDRATRYYQISRATGFPIKLLRDLWAGQRSLCAGCLTPIPTTPKCAMPKITPTRLPNGDPALVGPCCRALVKRHRPGLGILMARSKAVQGPSASQTLLEFINTEFGALNPFDRALNAIRDPKSPVEPPVGTNPEITPP
jgi:hypothetical protein